MNSRRDTEFKGDATIAFGHGSASDLWRGDDYGELGTSWRFKASLDDGETWVAYETQWSDEEGEGAFSGGNLARQSM